MSRKRCVLISFILLVLPTLAIAQASVTFTTTTPGDVLNQFAQQRVAWTTNIWGYANTLFGWLALIEFAWSAAVMAMEKSELQSWSAAMVRKVMWIGAFYALLTYGHTWIPAVIDSFIVIGQNASGLSSMAPSAVFMQGLTIAGTLLDRGSVLNFFSNPGSSFTLVFAAVLTVVSFALITVSLVMALAESYLCISAGYIFLGFGGSRWTLPYTERYIGLAVSIGVKLLLLYCLIGAGTSLGVGWATEAQTIGQSAQPALVCFDIMGGSLIYMCCCWGIPKMFASVIGGSPAFGAGDAIGPSATVAGVTMAAAATVGGAGRVAASSGQTGKSAAGGSGASGGSSSGARVPPPTSPSGSNGAGSSGSSSSSGGSPGSAVPPPAPSSNGSSPTKAAVPPPSSATAASGNSSSSSSGGSTPPPSNGNGLKRAAAKLRNFQMGDGAPHHTPPTMPINHEES